MKKLTFTCEGRGKRQFEKCATVMFDKKVFLKVFQALIVINQGLIFSRCDIFAQIKENSTSLAL